MQFELKSNHSTTMCSAIYMEIINQYKMNGSNAYIYIIMILLLLMVGVMVQCLFYLIYLLLLTSLIIDHYNLFCILKKYVGMCGNALKLIKSYFSNPTQRVQIDNVLSDFANIFLWCSSRLSFRTSKILFVFIASERYFKVS